MPGIKCVIVKKLDFLFVGKKPLSPLKDSMKEHIISFIQLIWLAPDLLYLSFCFYSGCKKERRTPFWRNIVECWVTSWPSITNAVNTDPKCLGNTLNNQTIDHNHPLPLFICAVISSVHICELPCASACTPKLAPQNKQTIKPRSLTCGCSGLPGWNCQSDVCAVSLSLSLSLPGEAPLIGHLFFHLSWEALCNFGKLATRSQHLTQGGQTLVPNLPAVSEAGLPVRLWNTFLCFMKV